MDNHKGFADGNKMNDKPMMKCRNHKLILLHCKSCGVYQTGTIYPHNMTKEQWRKWVACEAMKGMLSYSDNRVEDLKFIPKDAFDYADAFLKEGDGDE